MAESEHSIAQILKRHLASRAASGKNPRYPPDAYVFVCEGVDYTCAKLDGKGDVTGQELVDGLCDLAVDRFGYLAPTVLEHWGVTRTDDFGEIVFTLIDVGVLGKSPHDSQADFENVLDLRAALRERHRCDFDD